MTETPEERLAILNYKLAGEQDRQKAIYDHDLEQARAHFAERRGLQEIGASYANSVFRVLLVLNGGGAIGLLTFIGNFWTKNTDDAHTLAHGSVFAMRMFIAGLVFAASTAGLSYVSQIGFVEMTGKPASIMGKIFRWAAAIAAVFSLVAFVFGAIGASTALEKAG